MRITNDRGRPAASTGWSSLVAAIAYLLVALAVVAAPLRDPTRLLPYSARLDAPGWQKAADLDHLDQSMVVSVVARNAATLVTRPLDVFGDSLCFPMPHGYTLGEHMLGFSALAAIPWLVSGDPLFSFNVALTLSLLIAGVTMYVLARHFTRSASAAFVAGLLFELAPRRLADPAHPYIQGDLWTPLALLFLHRLLVRGRWRDALGCTVFLSLALLESLYPVVALAILLAIYGPYVIVRHRDRVTQVLPQLVAIAAGVLLVAWMIFGPYLGTKATWGLLGGRGSIMFTVEQYLPGSYAFPGFALLALVLLAMVDRLRGPRSVDGEDPRLAFLAATLLLLGCTLARWRLPLLGLSFPSPLLLVQQVVPGLDAVRALPRIGVGATLPLAVVAAYGVVFLEDRLPRVAARCAIGALVVFVLASTFLRPLARASFGVDTLAMRAWDARPAEEDVALVRQLPPGALLDVPFTWFGVRRLGMAHDLLRTSYSPRPSAACYNSFSSPVLAQIGDLALALPDPGAADALYALGFRVVMVERKQLLASQMRAFLDGLRAHAGPEQRLTPIGRTERLLAYALTGSPVTHQDLSALAASDADAAAVTALDAGTIGTVEFTVENRGNGVFRHPDPLLPSDVVLRWLRRDGRLAKEVRARPLLPLAIGAGATGTVRVEVEAPAEPGEYTVQGALVDDPAHLLLLRRIVVAGGSARPVEGAAPVSSEDVTHPAMQEAP